MLFYSDQDKTDPRSLDVSRETFPATLSDTRSPHATRLRVCGLVVSASASAVSLLAWQGLPQ
jgi:hypothetical protein